MNWKGAIEINRQALTRIVAELVALLTTQGGMARLPRPVYRLIAWTLHPAESAVRRLIVMMARGLVAPVPPARPMPKGLVIAGKGTGGSFPLFDTRKQFNDDDDGTIRPRVLPRIRMIDDPSPREQFLAKFARSSAGLISEAETAQLSRRLAILTRALATLPRQAQRMARWRARRAVMQAPVFTSPMRPGPPPGHRKRPRDEIDFVLKECHALAHYALRQNTS